VPLRVEGDVGVFGRGLQLQPGIRGAGAVGRLKVASIGSGARAGGLDVERKMSTGMKHGIAIPHGKTDSVSDLVACIGISDHPVDFDSLDQEPCRIFIMTLSPIDKTGPHLQFLAEVSLLFKSAEKRQEILNATDKSDIIRILTE